MKRRKPEGNTKGCRKMHILSIYPATAQKLRNLLKVCSAILSWTVKINFKRHSWHFSFIGFLTCCESVDLYKNPLQFRPVSLDSNLERTHRRWTKDYKFKTTISRSNRKVKTPLSERQKVHQKVREKTRGEWKAWSQWMTGLQVHQRQQEARRACE